ncbi:type II and III secretion system protein [Candidatus Woesearchaeota archaeon]|nr:type II and III secretion system protein [Candidatus Woesearchaeota archaeon]
MKDSKTKITGAKTTCLLLVSVILTLTTPFFAGCEETTRSRADDEFAKIDQEIETWKTRAMQSSGGNNIKIVLDFLRTEASEYSKLQALWQYTDENVAITAGKDEFRKSGLRIGVAGKDMALRLDAVQNTTKSSERTQQFIVVANNSTGQINVGTEIATPVFFYRGRRYSSMGYEFRNVGKFLEVTARKLGNGMVEVEVIPVFSNLVSGSGKMNQIRMTELNTKVILANGQSMVIGSTDGQTNNVANALLGVEKNGVRQKNLLVLTAHFTED